jgi:hypothetical protein
MYCIFYNRHTTCIYICMFQNYERREGICGAQLFERNLKKNLGSRNSAQPQNEIK